MTSKVASMRDAIADLVRDGDTVAIEGFTHLIGSPRVTRSSGSGAVT
jgi:acyl CoA:acetate/3-ketoacid CoA transferase alpha subunit